MAWPYDSEMKLYTPLSADEAERATSGLGFPDGEFFFVDNPDPDEADDDAVWVVIEIPDERALPFERPTATELGYREFALPASVAGEFRATRANLAAPPS